MSAVVAGSGGDLELQVAVKNVSEKPLLLPFGSLIGSGFYSFRFQAFVTTPEGIERRLLHIGSPTAVAGRIDPLVVPLVPNGTYLVEIPLAQLYVSGRSETLSTLIRHGAKLRVELDFRNASCPLYGPPNPNTIPCWRSKVVSNTFRYSGDPAQ